MEERIKALQARVAELALRERDLYKLLQEAEIPMKAAQANWYPVFQELQDNKAKLKAMQEIVADMKGETESCQSH